MKRHLKALIIFALLPLTLAVSGCGGGGGGGAAASGTDPASSNGSGTGTGSTTSTTPAAATAGVIKLSWDAPAETDVTPAGYRLKYGTASGSYTTTVDVGNQTSCTVSGLAPGTYYLAITAYDAAGAESPLSNEVTTQVP